MKILLYAFSNHWGTNVSRQTLLELEKISVRAPLAGAEFEIINKYPHQFFSKYIKNSHFDLIVGLGDGGKFLTKISIETQAKNNYLDKPIQPFAPILLDLNLPPVDVYDPKFFRISSNMGTYNCNWLAFQTQYYLNNYSSTTHHLFLHLPQRLPAPLLAVKILALLHNNQII